MNENYKGSIELISGLKQKNNLDFPLMEASAVAFYEEVQEGDSTVVKEIRLPDKLKSIGITDDEKIKLVDSVFTDSRFTNANALISENQTKINKLNTDLQINNEDLKIQYEESESMLYLFEGETLDKGEDGNVLASTIIKGGSDTAFSKLLTMQRVGVNKDKNLTFLKGSSDVILGYRADLIDADSKDPEGAFLDFTVTITAGNGASVTTKVVKNQPANTDLEFDASNFLMLGDNIVKIATSYSEMVGDELKHQPKSVSWTIKVVNLEIESDFNDLNITNANREVVLPITVKGDLNKTLYWSVNGEDFTQYDNITSINYTHNITLPPQSHGTCSVEVYAAAKVNDKDSITSKSLYFDIMRAETGNNKPIIRAVPKTDKREQYTTIPISFYVYQNNVSLSSIELQVVNELGEQEFYKKQNVEPKEEIWYYTPSTEGKKTLTITCGDTVKTLIFNIKKFPLDIPPAITSGLEFDFNPSERSNQDEDYDQFNYNNITWHLSENFNWKTGGWQVDENNRTYFCIKAGTTAIFDYKMFANSNIVSATGTEFKIIFKTANVANPNATWLQCLGETEKQKVVGLQMDVHNGYIHSSLNTLKIPYSEEDIIEFDMNITPFNNSNEKNIPMIMTYEDGTPAQPIVLTDSSTTFTQEQPASIIIGSPDCDIHIYRIKGYSNFLTEKEILTNFVADATGEEKAKRFIRNQIYDNQGRLTPQSVAEACPDLRVVCITAPRFTKGKIPETGWDKVTDTTIEMIYKNGGPNLNWIARNCQHTGQGTSSNGYGQAGRNIDLIMNKSGVDGYKPEIFLDSGLGEKVSKVALSDTSVPVNYFNIKVNIASSENANNALLQKRYDRYLPYKTGADVRDSRTKTTMEFFNCVVFVKETGYDNLKEQTETKVEFNDGFDANNTEFHFYGIGNIGDSKKTDDSRTSDPDDPNEFCVEIMDWNRILSTFPQDTMTKASRYIKKDTEGNITDYKFLAPENFGKTETSPEPKIYEKLDNGSYILTKDEEIDINNIDKYYIDILLNDDFSEDYTYGFRYLNDDENEEQIANAKAKWVEFYRFLTRDLTTNGKEDASKVAAWKEEFKDWFIEDAAFFYYLYTLRYTMVDNRAKNSFWHYGKVATTNDDGQLVYATDADGNYIYKFDFWDYDNDTALGIDNAGKLEMDYGVEDNDLDPTVGGGDPDQSPTYFRGASSTFFQRLVKYFDSEVKRSYSTYETKASQVFDSNHLIEEFDNWQSQFPEELWRLDYERKYKRPYVNGQGAAWDYAIPWSSADTRFLINMMNGKKKYQRRQFERNQDFYMSSKFIGMKNAEDVITLRGAGDLSGATGLVIPQDTTLYITPYMNMYINLNSSNSGGTPYESGIMLKAGETRGFAYDPSAAGFDFNVIYGASKIQSLGDLSKMYLQQATLSKGVKLKEAILGNSTKGYSNDNLTLLEITKDNVILEKLNVENLGRLTGSIPIDNNPNLKELYAKGSKISSVTFAQGGLIETAELPESVDTLRMKDLYFLKNLTLEKPDNLLELVLENTPNIDSFILVSQASKLARIRITDINWELPNATILNRLLKCKGVAENGVTPIDTPILTGTVYVENIRKTELEAIKAMWPELNITIGSEVEQRLVSFYNHDGALLGSTYVDKGLSCADPITELKLFNTPTKESTAQYDFDFLGWIIKNSNSETPLNLATVKIDQNTDFEAIYTNTIRNYQVSWFGADLKNPLHTVITPYGSEVVFDQIPVKEHFNTKYYLFKGWDTSTSFITGDTNVTALWAEADGADVYLDLRVNENKTADELSAIEIYALSQYKNKESFETGDFIEVQLGYMPTYSNDIKKERVLAENLVLDGSNYQVFNDIELFDEDKDFVIALDFTPKYKASGAGSFLSCYQGNPTKGIKIYNNGGKSTSALFRFGPQSTTYDINPSGHKLDEKTYYREICVIRHKKGSGTIELYRNNRYSLQNVDKKIINDTSNLNYVGWLPGSHPLVLGADYEGDSFTNNAIGTIHYAKIWFNDIGEDDCIKICSWIYNKMHFDYVGSNRYYYSNSGAKCAASFISQDLLDEKYRLFDRNDLAEPGGWMNTHLKTWMNTKLFNGLSIVWKQVLKQVVINSLQNTSSGSNNVDLREQTTQSDNYFYLPSLAEVTTKVNEVFLKELTVSQDGAYPVFGNELENATRIKTIDGIPAIWWLRTPYYSASSSTSTLINFNVVKNNGVAENSTYWVEDTGDGTISHSFTVETNYGICPCFSI